MPGQQRQFCYQSAHIESKSRLANKYENALHLKNNLNWIVQLRRNKCKTPLKQQTDILEEKRNSEHKQKLDDFEEKMKKISCGRRHTFYGTTKDQRDRVQKTNSFILSYERAKTRVISQHSGYSEQICKSKSGGKQKYKEKNIKFQEYPDNRDKEKQHSNTLKKLKKFNEARLPMLNTNGKESSFLSLINKFRFQNLKSPIALQGLESPFCNIPTKIDQKRQKNLTHFKVFKHEHNQREEQTQKFTSYHKFEPRQTKQQKKIGLLTPWQITDQIQFLG